MQIRSLIVLAGGTNARLRPLADTAYKAFLPIHGVSIAARQILQAHFAGVERVFLAIDEPDPLAERVAADSPGDVRCVLAPGSTADKVLAVLDQYPDCRPIAVSLGDTYVKFDVGQLAARRAATGVDSVVCVARLRVPYGVVDVTDERVVGFDEKPLLDCLIHTGYLLLGDAGIAALADTRDMVKTLSTLVAARALGYVVAPSEATSIDTLPLFAEAHERLRSDEDGSVDGGHGER